MNPRVKSLVFDSQDTVLLVVWRQWPTSVPIPTSLVGSNSKHCLSSALRISKWNTDCFSSAFCLLFSPDSSEFRPDIYIAQCSTKIRGEFIHSFWVSMLFLPPLQISLSFHIVLSHLLWPFQQDVGHCLHSTDPPGDRVPWAGSTVQCVIPTAWSSSSEGKFPPVSEGFCSPTGGSGQG